MYRGQEYTEPPTELIVEAILRHIYGAPAAPPPTRPYEMPENLRRFFAGRTAAAQQVLPAPDLQLTEAAPASEGGQLGCCPPAEQQRCCDASAKADCCGADTESGCGCL